MVSGFKNKIYFPLACATARLLAFAKPSLVSFQVKRTLGKSGSSRSLLPSVERLSTTNISVSFPFFSELQTYWEEEKQAPRLLKKFQEVQEVFNTNGITAQYRNYPDINFTKWDSLYYGSNYTRLQQVKNKYDPRNLFRYEQSIRNG